jgi:excisionase family DNA binding protein
MAHVEHRRLLSVRETAERLGLSQESVRRRIRRGELPALRLGEGPKVPLRIDEAELEHYVYGLPEEAA